MKDKLDNHFRETKPYLNPELKITDVSASLYTNRTYISQMIKENYHINFSGFVNSFRVEEAINLMDNDINGNYSIKGISEMAGFNNYNTFVAAFRKMKGMTPGIYKEKSGSPV